MLTILILCLNYSVKIIEPYSAKTTIRLWHELHREKKLSHDFSEMISPCIDYTYFALIRCNEIRSISECERNTLGIIHIKCMAHAPNSSHESALLLKDLFGKNIKIKKNCQIKWQLENMYLENSSEK
tara:strand:+ start:42 stop:422 length:381 start_codon:yes stop_codon:yes gene_type:complete